MLRVLPAVDMIRRMPSLVAVIGILGWLAVMLRCTRRLDNQVVLTWALRKTPFARLRFCRPAQNIESASAVRPSGSGATPVDRFLHQGLIRRARTRALRQRPREPEP
jgi:hypothetical protein